MSDEYWVKAMKEKLDQFLKNDVWKLVELPKVRSTLGAKWVFKS